MLIQSGLSHGFWGEAVMTSAYLINTCPSSVIEFKTPKERWSGKPPNLSNLRVFGCSAYVHQSVGTLDTNPAGTIQFDPILWRLEDQEEPDINQVKTAGNEPDQD
uniref:Uncharacterized protein n=1 Tax=Cannabis sativa TaxID=3483 RepID=A0A803PEQ1_CANSA